MKRRSFTVAQVNSFIHGLLESEPLLKDITIEGEVSNLKYHQSGHIYFDLKDESGKISAAMFRSDRGGLTARIKEGDQIRARGSISVYTRNGTYQLIARYIAKGAGDLFIRLEQLKKELSEMGMFDNAYKKPIPKFVEHLGIVTAPTGAAVRDIIRIARRRNPHLRITLYPAKVQGDGAAESIISGIYALNDLDVDVIIAGRGGGSIEDLWAFNEEAVARAIFSSEVPIISAVGHETDTTIADYVADRRAATPSEAAEIAIVDISEVLDRLYACRDELARSMDRRLYDSWQRLDHITDRLRLLHPRERILRNSQRIEDYSKRLYDRMEAQLSSSRHRLELMAERLEGNSPLRRLAGGYSYLFGEGGRTIRSVNDVKKGDRLFARVTDGTLTINVEDIEYDRRIADS